MPPRSTQSLLREFNSTPRVVINPFFNQGVAGPANGSRTPQTRQDEDVNTQLARSLLLDDTRSAAQQKRLRQIVAAGENAADRKRRQALADNQFRLLQAAGSNINNPLTTEEFQGALSEFQQEFGEATLFPNPIQLRRAEEETDNVQLDIANTAKSLAQTYGVDEAFAQSLIRPDPKTGRLPPDAGLKAAEFLRASQQASTPRMSAVRGALTNVNNQIKELQKNPVLFNTDGTMRQPPSGGFFGGPDQADVENFETLRFQFENLQAQRQQLSEQQLGFVESFNQPNPQRAAFQANQDVQAGRAQPAAAPAANIPANAGAFKNSRYTLQQGDNITDIANAAKEQARQTGEPVFITDPVTNDTYEIK